MTAEPAQLKQAERLLAQVATVADRVARAAVEAWVENRKRETA